MSVGERSRGGHASRPARRSSGRPRRARLALAARGHEGEHDVVARPDPLDAAGPCRRRLPDASWPRTMRQRLREVAVDDVEVARTDAARSDPDQRLALLRRREVDVEDLDRAGPAPGGRLPAPARGRAYRSADRRIAPCAPPSSARSTAPLSVEEVELAEPGPGEVAVRLAASGDLPQRLERDHGRHAEPAPRRPRPRGRGRRRGGRRGRRPTWPWATTSILSWLPSCGTVLLLRRRAAGCSATWRWRTCSRGRCPAGRSRSPRTARRSTTTPSSPRSRSAASCPRAAASDPRGRPAGGGGAGRLRRDDRASAPPSCAPGSSPGAPPSSTAPEASGSRHPRLQARRGAGDRGRRPGRLQARDRPRARRDPRGRPGQRGRRRARARADRRTRRRLRLRHRRRAGSRRAGVRGRPSRRHRRRRRDPAGRRDR